MIQLSGIDAGFLYSEGPTVFGHIGSVYFLDASTAAEPLTFERIRSIIRERLPLVPLYRRRLVEVPMGLDHPYWVEDPGFDLDDHVHHIALPSPGTDRQLADLIATLATRHLDRSRPLWELWVELVSVARLTRTGLAMRLVQANGKAAARELNPALIGLLVKARRWWARLANGEIDIATLAREERVNDSWMTRVVRLNFLAPEIVEAILAGQQPARLTADSLALINPLPGAWSEQRDLIDAL